MYRLNVVVMVITTVTISLSCMWTPPTPSIMQLAINKMFH